MNREYFFKKIDLIYYNKLFFVSLRIIRHFERNEV